MIHEVLFQAGNHSISCGISGINQGSPLHHFSQGFPHFENEVPAYSFVYLLIMAVWKHTYQSVTGNKIYNNI